MFSGPAGAENTFQANGAKPALPVHPGSPAAPSLCHSLIGPLSKYLPNTSCVSGNVLGPEEFGKTRPAGVWLPIASQELSLSGRKPTIN